MFNILNNQPFISMFPQNCIPAHGCNHSMTISNSAMNYGINGCLSRLLSLRPLVFIRQTPKKCKDTWAPYKTLKPPCRVLTLNSVATQFTEEMLSFLV